MTDACVSMPTAAPNIRTVDELMRDQLRAIHRRVDRVMAVLIALQWCVGVLIALVVSPRTWSGAVSSPHIHVWASLILGGAISILPILLAWRRPGDAFTRHVVAAAQILWSSLLVHLTGGRIETHFHIFGSLAILAWYRDWRVLATATIVTALDHLLRGAFWPQSVYGVLAATPWRTVEHAAWVLFEDVFLWLFIRDSLRDMRDAAVAESELQQGFARIENEVQLRTADLVRYAHSLENAQATLERQAIDLETRAAELALARQNAEFANSAKSEFLANMSHEIRTPLTAILGFADVLSDSPTATEAAEAVDTIKRNGQHLLQLINDILDLSKIEAGKVEVERIRCAPEEILEDVRSLLQPRAAAKGLALSARCESMAATIVTDPTRLRQILFNLVGNAIKFTDSGAVRVAMRPSHDPVRGRMLHVDVRDSGIGMTSEQLERLFQPFSQAEASTSRKFGGTGLGLAISRRLAQLLGGDITVQSKLGEGSEFTLTVSAGSDEVPDARDAATAPAYSVPHAEADADATILGVEVLLAEDGADNRRLISFLLKKEGARVSSVENGEQAVAAALAADAAGRPFDVVLMDMQMPVLDGYGATRKLRSVGYSRPIIALTAHAMQGDRQQCLDAGCDDYATKPIDRAQLTAVVAELARRGRQAAAVIGRE